MLYEELILGGPWANKHLYGYGSSVQEDPILQGSALFRATNDVALEKGPPTSLRATRRAEGRLRERKRLGSHDGTTIAGSSDRHVGGVSVPAPVVDRHG